MQPPRRTCGLTEIVRGKRMTHYVAGESGEPNQAPMNSPQTGLRPIEWYSKPCRRMRAGS